MQIHTQWNSDMVCFPAYFFFLSFCPFKYTGFYMGQIYSVCNLKANDVCLDDSSAA